MLRSGDVVAGRFEVLSTAGSGGMGHVYRVLDRSSGEPVALKVLHGHLAGQEARFAREAEVLARLAHPAIVGHVASGVDGEGRHYLAMEWVDGVRLDEALRERPLPARDAAKLCKGIAEALGVMHAAGIVHRDLKPGNLLLVGGSVERPKVLDLGIARVEGALSLTETGAMIGTPGWIAPEQARGERGIDARADVFALGCVLFRCLAGRAPFVAEDILGVLLKIALEQAPRVSELRADVPEALDELVARMLAKPPAERPASGAEVAAELARFLEAEPVPSSLRPRVLGTSERTTVCLVLAKRAAGGPASSSPQRGEPSPEVTAIAERHGAQLAVLADGSFTLSLATEGAATELAARGARAALELLVLRPTALALVCGRRSPTSREPLGEVIDRAVHLLGASGEEVGVRIDDVVAGLLDRRFEVSVDPRGLSLREERELPIVRRTLLGKQTPCVGRSRELLVLSATYDECVEESVARATLLVGPPGVGKSRVRFELLGGLASRADPPEVLFSRTDALTVSAPFGVAGQLVRHAAGVLEGEAASVRTSRLRARVARHVPPAEVPRVTTFLGELAGIPSVEAEVALELEAASRDPVLMGDQLLRAWTRWLSCECAAHPVLLVLEDLHWADLPTVRFVGEALARLSSSPLFVLALARPEVHEKFPRLWEGQRVQEVRVEELTRKSSESLVRTALGSGASPALVTRIAERAGGNALFLEELVRAAAEGRDTELPGSVLAMLEERVQELEPQARRALRAASVFGQSFDRAGLAELLGGERRATFLTESLDELVRREIVTRRGDRGVVGDEDYIIRHALLREAAYAMLTDEDRVLGHRLAAAFLAERGGADPAVLAEHFERGGEPERAASLWALAAQTALEGGDFAACIAHARRGAKEAVTEGPGAVGQFLLLEAEAHAWGGSLVDAERASLAALGLLAKGSAAWMTAVGLAANAAGQLSHRSIHLALGEDLLQVEVTSELRRVFVVAAARAARQATFAGEYVLADGLLARLDAIGEAEIDPEAIGLVYLARGLRAAVDGDLVAQIALGRAAVDAFRAAGDLRNASTALNNLGDALKEVGDYPAARELLEEALVSSRATGVLPVHGIQQQNLGFCLLRLGERDPGRAVLAASIELLGSLRVTRMEAASRGYLAMDLAAAGELAKAEREARAAHALSVMTPATSAWAQAVLADVLLAKGAAREALGFATEAKREMDDLGAMDEGEARVHLSWAAALAAVGRTDEARAAAAAARAWVRVRASRIAEPRWQQTFLAVTEHARIEALAQELGVVPEE